jgi:hypothetical protein
MVHLATVVGTRSRLLPHLFAHYRRLGVESLLVGIHLDRHDSPFLPEVTAICKEHGATIAATHVGPWFQDVNPWLYRRMQERRVEDWYLLADGDEFQVYPQDVTSLLGELDARGYEYVEGCLLDRVAHDGTFPAIVPDEPIWVQFPLAGLLTYYLVGGNILKIVAAKGTVRLSGGQHSALNGIGCPRRQTFIPVHHFKWSNDVVDHLRGRAEFYRSIGDDLWMESARFLTYLDAHDGRIDVSDPRFRLMVCDGHHPQWDELRAYVCAKAVELRARKKEDV